MAFLDHVLACFGALSEVYIDQRIDFFEAFEDLCTIALVDY